jgi:hypothetical protein
MSLHGRKASIRRVVPYELDDERSVRHCEQLGILQNVFKEVHWHIVADGLVMCQRTIFSVRPLQRSSPIALYCLLEVAIGECNTW